MSVNVSGDYQATLQFITVDKNELIVLLNTSKEFKYQGLDVQELNKLMIAKGKAAGRKDISAVMADIKTICMWIIMRGTNVSPKGKAMNSTSQNGKKTIETLLGIYSVKRTGKPQGPEDITMGRIASTYPHIILGIRVSLLSDSTTESSVRMIGTSLIPLSARFPTFGALIPKEGTDAETMYTEWVDWAITFDAVINQDKKNPENVRKYAEIMRMNSPLEDKMRKNAIAIIRKDPSFATSSWATLDF